MSHLGPPYLHDDPQGWLLRRCEPEPTSGCWIFLGARTDQGYGITNGRGIGKQKLFAHRIAYEAFRGPISAAMHVLHRCDFPPCVNPAHLFLGTNESNVADRVAKGRSWTKISAANLTAALAAMETREPRDEIAARFGISKWYLHDLRAGRRRRIAVCL